MDIMSEYGSHYKTGFLSRVNEIGRSEFDGHQISEFSLDGGSEQWKGWYYVH